MTWHVPAEAVTVMLAGPKERTDGWYATLVNDPRFRAILRADNLASIANGLASKPDVLLLDAEIFPGPEALAAGLANCQSSVYVLLPSGTLETHINQVAKIPSVQGVWQGDLNLAAQLNEIYTGVSFRKKPATPGLWDNPRPANGSPIGTRMIAVWNQAGGVGKTTIASNLAVEASRRGLPTLLVGLGAPDDLPLVMGLKAEPNISHWRANPSENAFRLTIQKTNTLDVIAGYPDVLSEDQYDNLPLNDKASLTSLVQQATYLGYAVIILDTPATPSASAAIAAANTLVLVARPALENAMRTVDAYRMVVERLSGEHHIAPENVHIVLNRMGGRMTAEEWHRAATSLLPRFPAPVTQIPDDPRVGEAQDDRRIPLDASPEFNATLKPLADRLFDRPVVRARSAIDGVTPEKKSIHLLGLKIRV